jgi:transketolase
MAGEIRRATIEQSRRAGVGHIGSSLSVADLLGALYGEVLRIPAPDDPERDRFILSKGHAALALYAALRFVGTLTAEQLETYCGDGTALGVHPEHRLAGIDFSTGSLGQGLPFGVGAALAARMQGSERRVFVLASDAECNEGSLWEAVMFAAHQRLANLVLIVDVNGQQALGRTAEVLDLEPLEARFAAFGWDVRTVDGHDVPALVDTIAGLETREGPPHVLLARTTFGKGVSFMEGKLEWHYWPLSETQYEQAAGELA